MKRVALAALAVLLLVPAAHAAPAPNWADTLVAAGLPTECAAALTDFLAAPTAPPSTLERLPPRADGIYARLAATGGIPYWGPRDALVRVPSTFDTELGTWLPRRDLGYVNRGYATFSPAPGRDLLIVDHMRSPISSATSVWEQTGARVLLRAEFPAEIEYLEDRGDAIIVHATDTFNAVALTWDKPAGAFVGHCLVRMDAATAYDRTSLAADLAPTPTPARVARASPISMLPPSVAPGDNYRLATLPKGERVLTLLTRPEGALVLAPWRDRSPMTKLFRARPDRLWQVGWLPSAALAPR